MKKLTKKFIFNRDTVQNIITKDPNAYELENLGIESMDTVRASYIESGR